MYRCSECNQTYKIKPDYCDCGNDVFEEIKENETQKEAEKQNVQNNSFAIKDTDKKPIESEYKKNMPSIIFFIFCIILSLIILFFIGNPKDEIKKESENKQIKTVQNIPDIDKIWNDEKPKAKTNISKKSEPKIVQKPEIQITDSKKEIKPTLQKPQNQTQSAKQSNSGFQKNTKQTQKISKNASSQLNQPAKVSQQIFSQKPIQSKAPVQKPAQQPIQQVQQQNNTQTTQTSQKIQTTVVVPKETQINPEELKQYKKALRNKIVSNINFLNIAGDGKCVLSFNISQSGVLTNRKFISQSQNTSLNDEVYSAMTKVSYFKTPPAGYKNETIKLTVKISGSNFEVSLE